MKPKPLRKNPALQTTKKNRSRAAEQLPADHSSELGQQLQHQVFTWDGITAAMTFSLPFMVVSINLQASLVLTLVLAAVLLPVSLLAFSLPEKLSAPSWLTAPVCALCSAGITALAAVIIRARLPQMSDTLGMYLYLLAAYPVVASVFNGKKALRATTTIAWSLRSVVYFGLLTGIVGIVRELLAYNRIFGLELPISFKIEGAKLPFFGFIMLAFVLAGVGAVHQLVKGRILPEAELPEEEYSSIEVFPEQKEEKE